MPFALTPGARRRGSRIKIETFPAKGFTATFRDAVTRGDAPDVLVFDNLGIMNGITTTLGRFEGIGEDPALRNHFVRVTGAFDELLGPERGWTYLFALSPNHETVRTLALRVPECLNGSSGPKPHGELVDIVLKSATAYLNADTSSLVTYSDPDQLATTPSSREPITVGAVQLCGVWGNDILAFVSVDASYVGESTIGHTRVLLVLRKRSGQWQLLVAARDPISNGLFVKDVASLAALLPSGTGTGAFPASAHAAIARRR